jgi:DMSO/TMAO reductase YedYZ molybdopterin-dependent catalytic subunit
MLPPGQRRLDEFIRFGAHFHHPPPAVPADPVIEVTGAVKEPLVVRVADLGALPRVEQVADFHCVAGWSATGLRWEGVAFETFFRELVEPVVAPGATVTHLSFRGLDGYRSIVTVEDARQADVLIADRLDGRPLDGDHGAPVRLVSPSQYGFVSTKHLCGIELHTEAPPERYHPSPLIRFGLELVKPHSRARVWKEERHRYLPAWAVRPVYRLLIAPIRAASARGSDRRGQSSS